MLVRRWLAQRQQRRLVAALPPTPPTGLQTRDWDYIPEIMLGLEQYWRRVDHFEELRERAKLFEDEVVRLLYQIAGRRIRFQASSEIGYEAPTFDPPRQIEGTVHQARTQMHGVVRLDIHDEAGGLKGYTVATGTPILIATQLHPEVLWAASRPIDDERQLWHEAEEEYWGAVNQHWDHDNATLVATFTPWLEKLVRLEAVKLRYWHDPYPRRSYSSTTASYDAEATKLVVGKLISLRWYEGEAEKPNSFHGFHIYNTKSNRREFYEVTRETSVTVVTEAAWEYDLPLELSIEEA